MLKPPKTKAIRLQPNRALKDLTVRAELDRAFRVPTDLDEPTTEDIKVPYASPYDDGS